MLQLLNLPPLLVRCDYLKLTTLYNIVNGYFYYPSGILVQNNSMHYYSHSTNFNFMHVPITCIIPLFLM